MLIASVVYLFIYFTLPSLYKLIHPETSLFYNKIHVKDYSNKRQAGKKDIYNAVETVTLKAQQGSGH